MCALPADYGTANAGPAIFVFEVNTTMFGRTTTSWFYNIAKPARRENGERKGWPSVMLNNHREKMLGELDVNRVLSYLVYNNVFSLEEYKEILSQETCKKRAEFFLDKLSLKGPRAFCAFCSIVEEISPHLLSGFLLDCQDQMHQWLQDLSSERRSRKPVSELEFFEDFNISDINVSPPVDYQMQEDFNEYRF